MLKNVTFDVARGESVGIIGPNGSGKTTLLRIIAGIIEPTEGRVLVSGRMSPFLGLGVGFQPEMTARENVILYGAIMRIPRRNMKNRIENVLEFAELQKFADTKLKYFSSGMTARLAFSTAIQVDPDILLIDEILAVGDIAFQQKCLAVFSEYKKQGKTILFVSHSLERRDGFSFEKSVNLWLLHVKSALEHTAGQPRFIVFYEDFLAD